MRLACLLMAGCAALRGACVIGGTVRDGETGKPLAHTRVFAKPIGDTAILRVTGTDGGFCFERLADGTYEVAAEKAGYLVSLYGARPGGDDGIPFEVGAEGKIPALTMRMLAGAAIAGTVTDAEGQPLSATVELSRKAWESRWTTDEVSHEVSGVDGSFRFSLLAPGTYYVSVSPSAVHPLETYYDGSYTFAHATPISVSAGQERTGIVVTTLRPATRHFSGSLAADLGSDATANLELSLPDAMMDSAQVPIRADGTFSVGNLAPAEYSFAVFGGGVNARGTVDLSGGDVEGFVIEPRRVVPLQVATRIEGRDGPATVPLRAIGKDGGFQQVSSAPGGVSNFSLAAGMYRFQPENQARDGSLYDKHIVVDGHVQPDLWLDLRGGAPGKVEVVLAAKTAGIEGRLQLRDGETTELAVTVVAVDEGRSGADLKYETTVADHTGDFAVGNLAAGKWRVFAIEGFDEGPWGSPELAEVLREQSIELELRDGRTGRVEPPVIAAKAWEAALRKVGM
jgi:hypothetical protein